MISDELKEMIRPHLVSMIPEGDVSRVEEMFSEVYYTTLNGIQRVTVKPITSGTLTAQFSLYTGEFLEMTDWEYIQTVGSTTPPEVIDFVRDPNEEIICALKHYHLNMYHHITDYERVIANRSEVSSGVFEYPCPGQNIYLDSTYYAVTYGRQRVDTNADAYYYNFSDINADSSTDTDLFEWLATYEWKRSNIWEE
ncbi:MAG: hypothetical protein BZ138_05990 [Methanosphaera sp. rholeuAM270]|nr:MAG: hypothetical protein BZ138_05990 [Methanosphaera sp. rholeuAM270]